MFIVICILAIGLVVLSYFDCNSTMSVLKRGTGHEENGAMAWLIATFPRGWPYIKIGATAVIAGVAAYAAHALPIRGQFFTALALAAMDAGYYWVVQHNYNLNKG